jgi:hypothetical protein
MINLNEYRNLKRLKIITEELEFATKLLYKQLKELKPYKKYVLIRDVINEMENSYIILKGNLDKNKRLLEKK